MRFSLYAAVLAVVCAVPSIAQSAPGSTAVNVSVGSPLALTFYVALKHPQAAEAKARSLQTPGSPDYHKFLTVPEFVDQYAVSTAELNNVENALQNLGFTVTYVYPNHLAIEAVATVGTAQQVLGVKMKQFEKDGHTGSLPSPR